VYPGHSVLNLYLENKLIYSINLNFILKFQSFYLLIDVSVRYFLSLTGLEGKIDDNELLSLVLIASNISFL